MYKYQHQKYETICHCVGVQRMQFYNGLNKSQFECFTFVVFDPLSRLKG
jgi:hypothetical protein